MMRFMISLAAGLGYMLCAETLVLVGNGVGRAGALFLIAVAAAAGSHLLGAIKIYGQMIGPQDETRLLQHYLGSSVAFISPLAARVSITVAASTSLLATAGYVFNEVFVHWFPNFLFAFLLLALLLAVGLAGGGIWAGFQLTVGSAACVGIAVLIIAGILLTPAPVSASPPPAVEFHLPALLWAMLVPMGYDLAHFAKADHTPAARRAPAVAVLIGSLLLVAWAIIALRWVPPAVLAQTTIPHTVTARAILGQTGRIIMGIVLLAGVAAAVNALYGGVSRMITGMSAAGLLPAVLGVGRFGGRLPIVLLAAATTTMLALGMAGSAHLNAMLEGAMILWLLHHAVLHLAALRAKRNDHANRIGRAAHIIGLLILGLSVLGLLSTHGAAGGVSVLIAVVAMAALFTRLLFTGMRHR